MTGEAIVAAYVFILAIFVGFEVVSKVPSTLHTPLMSGVWSVDGTLEMTSNPTKIARMRT